MRIKSAVFVVVLFLGLLAACGQTETAPPVAPVIEDTPMATAVSPPPTPPHAPLLEDTFGTGLYDEQIIILNIPSGAEETLRVMDIWSAPEGTPVSCASGFILFSWVVRDPYPDGGDDLIFQRLIPRGGGRTEVFASGATGNASAGWCDEITLLNSGLVEYRVEIRYASGTVDAVGTTD